MKHYFTTNKYDEVALNQHCPYGVSYARLGSIACMECPFCYGAGLVTEFGGRPKFIMIPSGKNFSREHYPTNYIDDSQAKKELLQQYSSVSIDDYIKCSRIYRDQYINKNLKLKFQTWWWHHIGYKTMKFRGKFNVWFCIYVKRGIPNLIDYIKYKIEKRKKNKSKV